MGIAFAVPYRPPAAPGPAFRGLELTWTGWDGTEWPLTRPASGLFLRPGVRGLHLPSFERQSSSSPMVAGSRHLGTVTKDRDVFWPLYLYNDSGSDGFVARDRLFWGSLDPDMEGTWTAKVPGRGQRTLALRLSGSDDDMQHDPIQRGWAKYAINLLADKPLWVGETIRRSWNQGDLRNYYVTEEDRTTYGYAPDVIHYLSSGGKLGTAAITNDGDVPAFAVWTVVGHTTDVSFGVAGRQIKVPFEIPAGYAVQFDTDPTDGQVLWYGEWDDKDKVIKSPVDRTKEMDPTSAVSVSIPRGQNRPLTITMIGTGTVIAEVRNKYRRAW